MSSYLLQYGVQVGSGGIPFRRNFIKNDEKIAAMYEYFLMERID
jgi:hypothetical protein